MLYFKSTGQMLVYLAIKDGIDLPVEECPKLIKFIDEYMKEHDKRVLEEGIREGLMIARERIGGGDYEDKDEDDRGNY
jgi:hypothetical protein